MFYISSKQHGKLVSGVSLDDAVFEQKIMKCNIMCGVGQVVFVENRIMKNNIIMCGMGHVCGFVRLVWCRE